jgi:hypothetical protein
MDAALAELQTTLPEPGAPSDAGSTPNLNQ